MTELSRPGPASGRNKSNTNISSNSSSNISTTRSTRSTRSTRAATIATSQSEIVTESKTSSSSSKGQNSSAGSTDKPVKHVKRSIPRGGSKPKQVATNLEQLKELLPIRWIEFCSFSKFTLLSKSYCRYSTKAKLLLGKFIDRRECVVVDLDLNIPLSLVSDSERKLFVPKHEEEQDKDKSEIECKDDEHDDEIGLRACVTFLLKTCCPDGATTVPQLFAFQAIQHDFDTNTNSKSRTKSTGQIVHIGDSDAIQAYVATLR